MRVNYKSIFRILFLFTVFLLVLCIIPFRKEMFNSIKSKVERSNTLLNDYVKINEFCNSKIEGKSAVIFEPNCYHHECLPGYIKYFTDLGYNVDVLIQSGFECSLNYFEPKSKVRIFTFNNLKDVEFLYKKISKKFHKYDCAFLQTTDFNNKNLIKKLGFFDNPKSMLVLHETDFVEKIGLQELHSKERLIGLADYGKLVYVNPNYFGEFPSKEKNKETIFYISSTANREYYYLLEAAKKLKDNGYKFKVKVTGHCNQFSAQNVPSYLEDCFEFYGTVPYDQLFSIVNGVDFIILNLNPNNYSDKPFLSKKASGSVQLSYGFYKPLIINSEFSSIYKLSSENSILYNDNELYSAMLKAINMSQENYSLMSSNLKLLRNKIYEISLNNLSNVLNKI